MKASCWKNWRSAAGRQTADRLFGDLHAHFAERAVEAGLFQHRSKIGIGRQSPVG
jgi:hypothetical protein